MCVPSGVLRTIVLAAAAIAASATGIQADCVVWPVNGHCYEAVLADLSFTDAQVACEVRGGHLATITSAEENDFIKGLFEDDSSFFYVDTYGAEYGPWIGGFQPPDSSEPAGNWQWVTEESWSYADWAPGQPDDANAGQDRLRYWRQSGTGILGWDDSELNNPSHHRRGYIFESEQGQPVQTSTWGRVKSLYR